LDAIKNCGNFGKIDQDMEGPFGWWAIDHAIKSKK